MLASAASLNIGYADDSLGLAWQRPGDLAVQLTLAVPLGNHPGQAAAGKNQDGSARETRAWAMLTKFF